MVPGNLSVIVDVDGHVRNIKVIRGLGYGLDENAVKAVRTWEFIPAMKDGIAVEATVPVECNFRTGK
jgi:TonB family protein